jgi:ribosomal protein L11 methyltransferase
VDLRAELAARVRPGGALLLAGILTVQAEAVTAAYKPWFDMEISGARDGWVALRGVRRQDR